MKKCNKCETQLPEDEYTGFCESCYVLEKTPQPKTQDEARQYAIDWQTWAGQKSLSYSELAEWSEAFNDLADRFDLKEEFTENGII